jgi:GST-like protein
MIELYYWTTPNGHKISIFLEEAGTEYVVHPVNISKGEQFNEDFLSFAPNNRIPAIRDTTPKDGGAPITIFESGAILEYLAEKEGQFLPSGTREKFEVLQWLYWQMSGLGPMAGQNHHFVQYAPERIPYAMERYIKETGRLYGVLNKQLEGREYICGAYSIADMACYPWVVPYERQQQNLDNFPNVKRWFAAVAARPAVQRAYAKAREVNEAATVTPESKGVLFGQTAR